MPGGNYTCCGLVLGSLVNRMVIDKYRKQFGKCIVKSFGECFAVYNRKNRGDYV